MKVIALSDTHIRDGAPRRLPAVLLRRLEDADAILHAGDIVGAQLLDELREIAPVHAVLGNNDRGLEGSIPRTLELDLGGVQVAMIHDSGARAGREARMKRRFPDAQVVVFGHSHVPLDAVGVDGQRLFNPGSPTQRRAQPRHTYGVLDLADGEVRDHQLVPLDP